MPILPVTPTISCQGEGQPDFAMEASQNQSGACATNPGNLPSRPLQAIITLDEGLRDSMTQPERDNAITSLFTGLTKAVNCGATVDLSNPLRIVVTKLES